MKNKISITLTLCFFALVILVNLKVFTNSPSVIFVRGRSESQGNPAEFFKRLPNALVIGAPKCGTRAVLDFLGIHPSVVTAPRELHFFDTDEYYKKGLRTYRDEFPESFPNQVVMEKSPSYLECKICPSRVKAMNASTRMIALLCDPVERLVSQYMQCLREKKNVPPFQEWITDKKTGLIKDEKSTEALRQGLFARSLENWFTHFPPEQFHIVNSKEFLENPAPEMMKVEKFLGLDPFFQSSDFYFNETKGFYCVNNPRWKGPPCLGDDKGHKDRISVDSVLLKKLQEYYRQPNENLNTLLGKKYFGEKR